MMQCEWLRAHRSLGRGVVELALCAAVLGRGHERPASPIVDEIVVEHKNLHQSEAKQQRV